jgi:hypothetical protein
MPVLMMIEHAGDGQSGQSQPARLLIEEVATPALGLADATLLTTAA